MKVLFYIIYIIYNIYNIINNYKDNYLLQSSILRNPTFLKTLMLDVRLLDPSTTLGMTSDYARDDGTTAG